MSMTINLTLNDELETKLKAIGTERQVSLSQVVRSLISEYELNHDKGTNNETEHHISKPNRK